MSKVFFRDFPLTVRLSENHQNRFGYATRPNFLALWPLVDVARWWTDQKVAHACSNIAILVNFGLFLNGILTQICKIYPGVNQTWTSLAYQLPRTVVPVLWACTCLWVIETKIGFDMQPDLILWHCEMWALTLPFWLISDCF